MRVGLSILVVGGCLSESKFSEQYLDVLCPVWVECLDQTAQVNFGMSYEEFCEANPGECDFINEAECRQIGENEGVCDELARYHSGAARECLKDVEGIRCEDLLVGEVPQSCNDVCQL